MKTRFFAVVLAVLLVGLLAVACTSTDTPETPATAAAPADGNTITGIVWNWQTLNDVAAGTSMRVDDPSKYTIVFNTDGTTTG